MGTPPILVALVGPTASGKTDLAVRAARSCGVPVEAIVLDSRQLYRGLDVGTGKPDLAQREELVHHLLDRLDPRESFDAARYRAAVEDCLPAIAGRGAVPLLVGGAGFYLRALREGFHAIPSDPRRLGELRRDHAGQSSDELWRRLNAADPITAARLHPHDRYRVGRALEIHALSGRRPSELEAEFEPAPVAGARFEVVHLSPARATLHERIERRTREWLGGSWADEVRGLLEVGFPPDCAGLRILGYREVVSWVRGRISEEEARERIVVATRRYARQQETWFRKEHAVTRGEARPVEDALCDLLRRAAGRS